MVTEHDAKKAGAEVVKQIDAPFQSGLLYPGLQALDEEYLKVDAQLGGVDQRKIFTYAEKYLPKLGYSKRSHLMNPMVPGLTGGKMSSSEVDSKIDLLDSEESVTNKLMRAECSKSNLDNGILAFIKTVIFPILKLRGNVFHSTNGCKYSSVADLISAFSSDELSEEHLKNDVINFLNNLLDPIRKDFDSSKLKEITRKAYPLKNSISLVESSVKENIYNISLPEKSSQLIFRNLSYFPRGEQKFSTLSPRVLWSIFVTSKPNISLLGQISKIRDFLQAGCSVTVLVLDIVSHMDGGQVSWNVAPIRAQYYIDLIKSSFEILKIPLEKVSFVKGSDYQCGKDYALDLYRVSAQVTCKESGEAVTDFLKDPSLLSALLIPDMLALDEKHNKVDIHFGCASLVPLFQFAEKVLKLVDDRIVCHLCYESLPSLLNKSPLSPEEEFIDLIEPESSLKKKIKSSFCESGNISFNPVLSIVKLIIMPFIDRKFKVCRTEENGGDKEFSSFQELQEYFGSGNLHPGDLKGSVLGYLKTLIEPIRKASDSPNFKKLLNQAFPSSKKEKKAPLKGNAKISTEEFTPSKFDMRVGQIIEVMRHPEADSLYVEKINIGEDEPRTIVSGLVKYVPIEDMHNRKVVVLANLKPQSMRGIKSAGMVLCASVENCVEPLIPPPESSPGERVIAEGYEGDPDPVLNTKKSDALTKMLEGFKTNASLRATWNGNDLCTAAGAVMVKSLKNAPIK